MKDANENKNLFANNKATLQAFRERKQKAFNPDEITIEKAGKTINVNQWIQEGREDTEIYPMIEKYHGKENIPQKLGAIIGDLTEYQDLRSVIEKEKHAQNMWNNLPLEVRQHFGNDKYRFIEDGMKWATDYQKSLEPKPENKTAETNNVGEQNNG